MSRFSSWTPRAIALPFGILVMSFVMWSSCSPAFGTQDEFQVGDLVQFDFLGKTLQGKVTKFTASGWPYVQFEYRGDSKERFWPPHQLTLVESVDGESKPETAKTKMRSWTDSTGAFSQMAKLLSNKNGKVELEKEDGRVITLPAENLSEADQKYLKQIENETSPDNPFAGGEMKANPANKTGGRKTNVAEPSEIPAITPDATVNEIVLADNGWNVQPDAVENRSPGTQVIGFESSFKKHAFHNRLSATSFTSDKRLVATSLTNPFEKASDIIVIDLEAGKSSAPHTIPIQDGSLLAISPSGARAVTYRKGQGREKGSVDFWKLGETVEKFASWNAASFFDRTGFSPSSAHFLDESRLLTFGRSVILWDCETAAALYSFASPSTSTPALSANSKQIAVGVGAAIFIIDTQSGNTLGKLDLSSSVELLAFSTNGRFLAGVRKMSGEIRVWDLTTGELVREFATPGGSGESVLWVGEKYLLVNGTHLMDVELRATVWRYRRSTPGSVVSANDGRFWFAGKTKFAPLKLPHKNFDDQTAKFDPDQLLVLKPGTEVSIKFDLPFPPAEQKSIRDKLISRLETNGVTVKDGASLVLVASIKKGKQESVETSDFTDPFGMRGTETIRYSPNVASVYLEKNGTRSWGKFRRFGPAGIIRMQRGETAQQAADRLCQPDARFFKSIEFPKYIAQLPSGKPLGESQISEQGIQ